MHHERVSAVCEVGVFLKQGPENTLVEEIHFSDNNTLRSLLGEHDKERNFSKSRGIITLQIRLDIFN